MVYLFCRVSSIKQQTDGTSLDAQEELLNKYAKKFRWNVNRCSKFVGSAYKKDVFGFMSSSYKRQKIVFTHVDRFSRNYEMAKQMIHKLIRSGNQLYFIKDKLMVDKDHGKHYAKLLNHVKEAERESRKTSERVSRSKSYGKMMGYYTGGTVPYGKKVVRRGKRKYLANKSDNSKNIIKFILACKTIGTHVKSLNKLLYKAGGDTVKYPLVLGNDGYDENKLETDMSCSGIALLLNDYSVGKKKWTPSMIMTVYKNNTICVHPETDDEDEDLVPYFDNLDLI